MSTYDNLNIAQATLIFDTNGNPSVGAGEFDLSTMAFLPNVPLIDQIEVERVFDTGSDTKFGGNVFTVADRREMFIFPKNWYTINEQTKILKFIDLNTIETGSGLVPPVYYPLSRSYKLILQITDEDNLEYGNTLFINIPPVLNTTTDGPPVRQYDKVYIRRKTPSINSIVTFAPGTRLTTTQLNLQFDQLKYIVQELLAKVKNEIILKYDENAIDGPFLGNTDLKMNNNFIKDAGTKQITETLTMFTGLDNIAFSGGSVTPNVLAVNNAVTKGSLYRTGLVASPASFTGDFTTRLPDSATDYKITNLAPGTDATDAVNLSQLNNADNLTTGTVGVDRLPSSIPLAKLSSAAGQTYTLPLENLPDTLTAGTGAFGANPASNAGNMLYGNVNGKGLLTSLYSRNMTGDDLPTVSTITAQAYGGTGKLLSLTADAKGRITAIAANDIVNADLPLVSTLTPQVYGSDNAANPLTKFEVNSKGIITSASHRAIVVSDLPTTGVTQASTYGSATATNTQNMLQIAYDTTGRVTLASHRNMGHDDLPANIPLSKLSNALSQSYILPKDAIADGSILFAKLDTATENQSALPLSFIPNGIILSKINPATPGNFILPDACLNTITTIIAKAYSASPIKDITVDTKGRIIGISERAIVSGDIPALSASAISITTSPFAEALIPPLAVSSAGSYGSVNNIPTFTVDTKGRVTVAASSAAISTGHISDFNTNTNSLIDTRAISLAGGAFYNANNKLISNVLNPVTDQDATTKKWIVDNYQSLSGFNAAAVAQIQENAPFWDSANSRFTALRSSVARNIFGVATPTVDSHAANKLYVDDSLTSYTTTATLSTPIDARLLTNSVYLSAAGILNAGGKPITNVGATTNANDVVTKSYLEANAIYATGTNLSAGNKYLTDLVMRPSGSLSANDAVNFGYIESAIVNAGGAVIGTSAPQVFRQLWSSGTTLGNTPTTGFTRYRWSFVDGTNPLYASSAIMMLVETDGGTKTFTPNLSNATAGTVYDGYFWLDTSGGATKVLNVYVNSTPTGNITIRNFGLSRIVSSDIATTSAAGLVSIDSGTEGGIAVTGLGAISLKPASSTQIGGIKTGTGLVMSGSTAAVDLSDSTTLDDSSKVATSKAVRTLSTNSMLLTGTQQMTGKLRTATATTAIASLSIPPSAATLGTLFNGDLWNLNDVLQFRTTSATKQIAYRDAATISNLGLVQISTGNDSGLSITGPGVLSIVAATTTVLGGIKLGNGLTITSGVAAVNLTDTTNTSSSTTAASATAVKAAYDYAVGVQSNLTTTNNNLSTTNTNVTAVQTTANNALPKAGGEMAGMLQLVGSTSTRSALRFVGGSAPTTSLTAGDVWFESNILKMRIGTTTKDIAFTDSALTGTAATATKLANERGITLTGPVTGTVNFDGSQAVSIATTIATDAVALGTNTTGAYVATASGTDGVSVAGSGGESAGITISNTDKGSSQAIFKTITPSSGTSVTATTNASTLNLSGSGNITVTGSGSTITIANTATAPISFGTIEVTGTSGQTAVAANSSAATLTLNAGTGMSITTNAGSDIITLTNTGITSISGTTNQVTVSAGTTPTISLPQNIHSAATPTFGGATLGSIVITSAAANTLTTTGNLDLILDPAGTGKISLLANVDCASNTLTTLGACTFGTVSCDAITFKTNGTKLKLGTTASTVEATIGTVASVSNPGDIVLRVPASGKAFLIAHATDAPTAGTALITKTALDTAVASAISGGSLMPTIGAVPAAAQTLGCTVGDFNIQTGSPATNRLTIVNGGAATFTGALTVTGGTILSSTLVVANTTTLNQEVTVNSAYNVTAGKAPSAANHLANKTYVDNAVLPQTFIDTLALLNATLSSTPPTTFYFPATPKVGTKYYVKWQNTGINLGTSVRSQIIQITCPAGVTARVAKDLTSSNVIDGTPSTGNGWGTTLVGSLLYPGQTATFTVMNKGNQGNGTQLTKSGYISIEILPTLALTVDA